MQLRGQEGKRILQQNAMPALRNIPEKRIIANYSDFAQFIAQKVQEGDCPHAEHAPTAMLL